MKAEFYLKLAADVAQDGEEPRNDNHSNKKQYLLGAVAKRTDDAVVVSTNIFTKIPHSSGHAEARVLKKADIGCTLYVARVTRDGKWAISKPCENCQKLIRSRRVLKVYYTICENEFGIWYPDSDKWYHIKREK